MHSSPTPTAWAALNHSTYRSFWMAGVLMGTGSVIQDVTTGWLMTSLTSSPLLIALLQTASSLPVLLFALPAGALADIVDRRKLMLGLLLALAAVPATLGVLNRNQALTPELLLALVFLGGSAGAFFTPGWMRTVPDLLPGPQVPSGVTLNSTAVNIARLLGATIAGLLLASRFPGCGFFVASAAVFSPAIVLWLWSSPPALSQLPRESFFAALSSGLSYARHSSPLRSILLRTVAFSLFGSAIPALLPVVARQQLHLDALYFGLLTATFGGGALLGATVLVPLRKKLSLDALLLLMTSALALSALAMARFQHFLPLSLVLLLAGAAWVTMVASFGVATGSASPSWVLSRMLSFYMLTFQGGAALGGLLWGQLAQSFGVDFALQIAAAGLTLGLLLRWPYPMPAINPASMAPSQHWPSPAPLPSHARGDGPALVSIEYRILPDNAPPFRAAMSQIRLERLRDGAFEWHLFHSPDDPELYLEQFLLPSWTDHLRQHERVTLADLELEKQAHAFHIGPNPPLVRHWLSHLGSRHGARPTSLH